MQKSTTTLISPLLPPPSKLIPLLKKRFLDFCSLYRPTSGRCFPADEDVLIQYAAFLARSIKYSSIKGYLAAVRHLHIRRGFALDLNQCLRLQLVCRGIKRFQGTTLTRKRLPITIKHLRLFYCLLKCT